MSLEKEIIQLLERYRDVQCGGKANKAAENLGVTQATFSRWVNGAHLPKVESLIEPFERLNARIVIGPSSSVEADKLREKCRELERSLKEQELSLKNELLKAKDEIICLQKKLNAAISKDGSQQSQEDAGALAHLKIERQKRKYFDEQSEANELDANYGIAQEESPPYGIKKQVSPSGTQGPEKA